MKFPPKASLLLLVLKNFYTSKDQRRGNQSKLFRVVENKFTIQKTEFERSNFYHQHSDYNLKSIT